MNEINRMSPPGRFLKLISKNPKKWVVMDDIEAMRKARRALREKSKKN